MFLKRSYLPRFGNPEAALLTLVVAVAAFFRLFDLASLPPGLYADEAVNGVNALQALKGTGLKVFYPENFGREGLFINTQALSVWLFGPEAWALRLVSAVVGILTVWGMYFLGKELFRDTEDGHTKNAPLGLVAAYFTATSFWHINFSRIGFRAIMAPLWSVWGFYFVLVAWRELKAGSGLRVYGPWAFLGGTVFGLGLHSYIAYRAMPLLLGLFLSYQFIGAWKSGFMRRFLAYAVLIAVGAVLAALPLALYYIENPADFFGRTNQISVLGSEHMLRDLGANIAKTAGMFNVVGDFNERHNVRGRPELYWPVGLLFLVGIGKGLTSILRRGMALGDRLPYYFLFGWMGIAALPVVISNEGLPHALRGILMLPPVMILAAAGTVHAYAWSVHRITLSQKIGTARRLAVQKSFAAVLVALLAVEAYVTYFVVWATEPGTARAFNQKTTELAYELRQLPKELRKIVVVEPGNSRVSILQFLTDTATEADMKARNLYYARPGEVDEVRPSGYYVTRLP